MSEESRLGREQIETASLLKQLITAGIRVFYYLEDRGRSSGLTCESCQRPSGAACRNTSARRGPTGSVRHGSDAGQELLALSWVHFRSSHGLADDTGLVLIRVPEHLAFLVAGRDPPPCDS